MATVEKIQVVPAQAPDELSVIVNGERCAGCQECVVRCPTGALHIAPDEWIAQANNALCVGCRQCERTCPFGAIAVRGPVLVPESARPWRSPHAHLDHDIRETRPGFSSLEQARREAERCLGCPDPTCVLGCPTHNDIPSFIAAVRSGDLSEAQAVLRRTSVMPDICSRVCDQSMQCEGACSLRLAGTDPVAIGLIERFITDNSPVPPVAIPARTVDTSVAIVGSGPAAVGAAWRLLEAGVRVTMFERSEVPGGVPNWGIPEFTLPGAIARRPIEALVAAGLDLRCGTAVDTQQDLQELAAQHGAVLLAHGASAPMGLRVPGTDYPWVQDATTFLKWGRTALRDRKDSNSVCAGSRVLVVGAGNTAMDVARTARRLGAEVIAVDWVDRRFARVRPDELREAAEEGVEIRFGRSVLRFEESASGNRSASLAITEQRRPDRLPRITNQMPERVQFLECAVLAMGYRVEALDIGIGTLPQPARPPRYPDRRWLGSGLLADRTHPVAQLAQEREANLRGAREPLAPGVYVIGDARTGPATVVAAMAQGAAAARELLVKLEI